MINLLLCTPIGDSACFGMFGPNYYEMDEDDSRAPYKRGGAPKYHHHSTRTGNDHHRHHHGSRRAWIRKMRSVPHSSGNHATMIERASPLSPPALSNHAGLWRDAHHAYQTSLLDAAPVDPTLMSRLSGILEAGGPLHHYHALDWDDLVAEDAEFGYRLVKSCSSTSTASTTSTE